ncbi:hypothetical protein F946_02681 [Acinetobacter johnsonii ANC 3681]|uniref:DUF5343 domain-containing protein n=1 Tax=Acinetobacter johnsonii ANC 3681 TaxID=1217662 RepID=N9CY48_ACIJO|nr:DUF5343 domain-containing protein [Acinetobacter johnsonii]ENV73188.1 hypothetical protein F946_02681 [Acinetobacter johnsonii ANC 3681]
MSTSYPPYMNSTGLITKILEKIRVAATPDRFTQDFLSTELGFNNGGARAFISLAKKIGFLSSDGSPTDLYKQFRNSNTSISKAAMAEAIKKGYSDIYIRNEYAHNLSKNDLEGLIMEMTGSEKGNKTVQAVIGSFEALKRFASFNVSTTDIVHQKDNENDSPEPSLEDEIPKKSIDENIDLNLSYTINLVLPKTDDVAVFNAIFKSLREHLLRK